MSFDVAADAYDRFMGRFSRQLSPQLADYAGMDPAPNAATWWSCVRLQASSTSRTQSFRQRRVRELR